MDIKAITKKYEEIKDTLPKEARAIIEALIERDSLADEVIQELAKELEVLEERNVSLRNAYMGVLDRS